MPWTRLVQAAKTTYKNHTVDLPDFVMKHRAKLVLRPNDDSTDLHPVRGHSVLDQEDLDGLRPGQRKPLVDRAGSRAVRMARDLDPDHRVGDERARDIL